MLFQEKPYAFQLHLHYDDLEVSNPLGSRSGIHKIGEELPYLLLTNSLLLLGVFYYSLSNLHPTVRSVLHSIQLVAVVNTSFIQKYGIDKILEPFMGGLHSLEMVICSQLKI